MSDTRTPLKIKRKGTEKYAIAFGHCRATVSKIVRPRPSTASAFISSIRRDHSRGGVAFSGKCLATSNNCACLLSSGLPPPGGEARGRAPPFLAAEVPSSVPSNGASQKAIVRASPSAAAAAAAAIGAHAFDRGAAFMSVTARGLPDRPRLAVSEVEIDPEAVWELESESWCDPCAERPRVRVSAAVMSAAAGGGREGKAMAVEETTRRIAGAELAAASLAPRPSAAGCAAPAQGGRAGIPSRFDLRGIRSLLPTPEAVGGEKTGGRLQATKAYLALTILCRPQDTVGVPLQDLLALLVGLSSLTLRHGGFSGAEQLGLQSSSSEFRLQVQKSASLDHFKVQTDPALRLSFPMNLQASIQIKL
nr:unnamed protein product [Digitaria exilis]